MKVLFVYPRFARHAEAHPELLDFVPMNEYLGSPSLGIAMMAATLPPGWEWEFRDDRLDDAMTPTDADVVALSFFTASASRAMQIGDYFKAQGVPVVAGGIFPTMMPDVVQPHVDAVVVGEGEPVWPRLLADLAAGQLKPRYGVEVADLANVPVPDLSVYFSVEGDGFCPDDYPVQISRGCPLSCRACALPKVMGKTIRCFSEDHVMKQLAQLAAVGKQGCLTEDTNWLPGSEGKSLMERVFQRLIDDGTEAAISYVGISMPMILMTPEKVLKKARAAGVDMFYLVGGFDPVTMGAFTGKNQRAWDRGVRSIRKALDCGIEPYTSFLFGGDQDDEGTVDRMLEFAHVAGINKAEFALATPYPGTPHYHELEAQGRILHKDWSRYNDANMVFQPAQMSPEQATEGYLRLWRDFYADKQHLADQPAGERTIQF